MSGLLSRALTSRVMAVAVSKRLMGGAAVPAGAMSARTGYPVRTDPHPKRELIYEEKVSIPIPEVSFIVDPTPEQQKLLEKMKGDWKQISRDEAEQIYRMRFQYSLDEIGRMNEVNQNNVFCAVLFFICTGVTLFYLLNFLMWDRSPTRHPFMKEPRMIPLRCEIKKFLNASNDLISPDYLRLKVADSEVEGVDL